MATAKKAQNLGLVATAPTSKKVDPDDVTINVSVPVEIHRALRMKAIDENMTLRDAVSAAIEEWAKEWLA